ncbi:MAG: SDR family NAD(P)-dependent oxidoreductase [Gemmatimonadota bacterium]
MSGGPPPEARIPEPRDLLDFRGQVVVVTGASGGVGAGIARRFASAGADVVVHFRSDADGAERIARAIHEAGCRAVTVRGDLTVAGGAERVVDAAVEELGGLDVLVNNAGAYPLAALLEMTDDEWRAVLDANLTSTFLCTRAAARCMRDRGTGGAIVNIASIEGRNPAPLHAHYNAAKGGVLMLTKAAANELAPHGVRVNSVSPGLIGREGIEAQWPEGVDRWRRACPLERLGRPDDVADACLFLASPAARWITGADLRVDGGVMTSQIF